jgi:hypothetical protein
MRRDDGLRETIECPPCSEKAGKPINKAVHACAVHGRCITDGAADGIASCGRCNDYSTELFQLTVNAAGIGDHLAAASIAAAWKDRNPGKKLHIVGMSRQWIELFDGVCDSLATTHFEDLNQWREKVTPGSTPIYAALNDRGGLHFIEAAAKIPLTERKRPTTRPLPTEAEKWAQQFRGCVILAPISLGSGAGRNWLMSHWLVLERMLNEHGLQCVAIGSGTDAHKLAGFRGQQICGRPAAHVAALMKVAACVVSNESGMGHLAGALNVPAIVLAAQLIAAPIYAAWASVRIIQGPLACGGCRWTGPNWKGHCDTLCANLNSITPDVVLSAVMETAAIEPPFVLDRSLDQKIKNHVSKLLLSVKPADDKPVTCVDRRPTMRAFMREIIKRENPFVVETGCQRAPLDYGAGMATSIIGLLLSGHGGQMVSIDLNREFAEFCKKTVKGLPVDVVVNHSHDWFHAWTGRKIDALYLDSQDTWDEGFEDCNLEEAKLAMRHLEDDAVVMIDDTWRVEDGWTGKGRKTVPWLLAQGFTILLEGNWQVVLKRRS